MNCVVGAGTTRSFMGTATFAPKVLMKRLPQKRLMMAKKPSLSNDEQVCFSPFITQSGHCHTSAHFLSVTCPLVRILRTNATMWNLERPPLWLNFSPYPATSFDNLQDPKFNSPPPQCDSTKIKHAINENSNNLTTTEKDKNLSTNCYIFSSPPSLLPTTNT